LYFAFIVKRFRVSCATSVDSIVDDELQVGEINQRFVIFLRI
jgi:hypothetical protein